ncbi:MAG: hypothetical protein E6J25_06890 [Chloroflexi bacterium]|nr:MAG: hypothetical protein E6J25_06890 [Chloroflexota bacterium]
MEIGKTVRPRSSGEWRRWLVRHHADTKEIWLVYFKKASGKSGISYEESVVEGLAYGWVDSQAKTIDEATYAVRFTPRKPASNWSASNIARVKKLLAEGRMAAAGLATLPESLRARGGPVGPRERRFSARRAFETSRVGAK